MSAEITTLQVINSDISSLTVTTDTSNVSLVTEVTSVKLQTSDIRVLTQTGGTINLASLNLATSVTDIARTGVVGVSDLAARADHVHSAADLLVDGGNY